jgi:hypothetical protein
MASVQQTATPLQFYSTYPMRKQLRSRLIFPSIIHIGARSLKKFVHESMATGKNKVDMERTCQNTERGRYLEMAKQNRQNRNNQKNRNNQNGIGGMVQQVAENVKDAFTGDQGKQRNNRR